MSADKEVVNVMWYQCAYQSANSLKTDMCCFSWFMSFKISHDTIIVCKFDVFAGDYTGYWHHSCNWYWWTMEAVPWVCRKRSKHKCFLGSEIRVDLWRKCWTLRSPAVNLLLTDCSNVNADVFNQGKGLTLTFVSNFNWWHTVVIK